MDPLLSSIAANETRHVLARPACADVLSFMVGSSVCVWTIRRYPPHPSGRFIPAASAPPAAPANPDPANPDPAEPDPAEPIDKIPLFRRGCCPAAGLSRGHRRPKRDTSSRSRRCAIRRSRGHGSEGERSVADRCSIRELWTRTWRPVAPVGKGKPFPKIWCARLKHRSECPGEDLNLHSLAGATTSR
mgnify:CR=1 FL=1